MSRQKARREVLSVERRSRAVPEAEDEAEPDDLRDRIPLGLLLGFGSVIFTRSVMTQADFTAWGWRVLFVLGLLVAIVGIIIRPRTEDSFVFERHRTHGVLERPEQQVWREMPWTVPIGLIAAA